MIRKTYKSNTKDAEATIAKELSALEEKAVMKSTLEDDVVKLLSSNDAEFSFSRLHSAISKKNALYYDVEDADENQIFTIVRNNPQFTIESHTKQIMIVGDAKISFIYHTMFLSGKLRVVDYPIGWSCKFYNRLGYAVKIYFQTHTQPNEQGDVIEYNFTTTYANKNKYDSIYIPPFNGNGENGIYKISYPYVEIPPGKVVEFMRYGLKSWSIFECGVCGVQE